MPDEPDDLGAPGAQLDRAQDVTITLGLVLSGMVFAAGVAGFFLVINRVTATVPPSFGSQGEWLYGAVASLLVAGWGFSQAAKLYARRRRSQASDAPLVLPKVEVRPDGFLAGIPRSPTANRGETPPRTWTWSFSSKAAPIKTLELTESQIAAAEAIAQPDADWDAVARKVNSAYATWSGFEKDLYRHALQVSVEKRRGR